MNPSATSSSIYAARIKRLFYVPLLVLKGGDPSTRGLFAGMLSRFSSNSDSALLMNSAAWTNFLAASRLKPAKKSASIVYGRMYEAKFSKAIA